MERTDSTTAITSLQADYGDSDEEVPSPSAVDNISDEDAVHVEEQRPASVTIVQEENSNSSAPEEAPKPKLVKKATRLVSYGPDDLEEDEQNESEEEEEEEGGSGDESDTLVKRVDRGTRVLNTQDASALSRSVRNKSLDEIEIPPEPNGKCPKELQDKITKNMEKMGRVGLDLNATIQQRKDFRNPSIYEKLIEFCHIDEKGTNFPPDIYDPHMWSKESYYDELDKAQKKEMEKREKERKERTKIEFISGTKKSASDSGAPDEKKRKTKWDTQPQPGIVVRPPAVPNPSVVTLTTTATGTKTTVIPAVGNITRKLGTSQK